MEQDSRGGWRAQRALEKWRGCSSVVVYEACAADPGLNTFNPETGLSLRRAAAARCGSLATMYEAEGSKRGPPAVPKRGPAKMVCP